MNYDNLDKFMKLVEKFHPIIFGAIFACMFITFFAVLALGNIGMYTILKDASEYGTNNNNLIGIMMNLYGLATLIFPAFLIYIFVFMGFKNRFKDKGTGRGKKIPPRNF